MLASWKTSFSDSFCFVTVYEHAMAQVYTASATSLSDRFVGLAEYARALGRAEQADRFLLLAWAAFEGADLPVWRYAQQAPQSDQPSDSAA